MKEISNCCKASVWERGASILDLYCSKCKKSLGRADIIKVIK